MSKEIKIKSSLLNDKDFDAVRNSIVAISQIDNEENFRVKLIEYINDTADNDDDMFFYNMLTFVRFLDPARKDVAFTDQTHRIFLNAPGTIIGKNMKQWDFTYDHECLHQLWDTFGVADKIKKNGYEYNHFILNVASDCVINDYLYYYRKKDMPNGLITPEYLKDNFGVEYDRKLDTQYSLYLQLIEKKDELLKDQLIMDNVGKLKPKDVKKQPTPPPPPGPDIKHSPDYIKGWKDAIVDAIKNNVDPTKPDYKPKNTGNDEYDSGYNDCMEDIKKGLEDGITMSDNPNSGGNSGDLPQIPWDTGEEDREPNDEAGGGGSSDSEGDGESQQSGDANSAKNAADAAQDAADKAKAAADAAQNAADEAGNNGDENASDLQNAADKASEAADRAQDAADKASAAANKAAEAADDGDEKGEAEAAQEAADAAKEAADAAREAASAAAGTGDKNAKDAANDAKEAADNADKASDKSKGNKSDSSSKGGSGSKQWGSGHIEAEESEEDLERLRQEAEEIIKDYSNKLAGDLGEFVTKCKSSGRMEQDGLRAKVVKGVKGWNTELDQRINKYVKQKVFQKKRQYEQTYSRIKRGTGYVKMGEPLKPGRRVKEETMILNAAFYVDRSGSMGSALQTVFDAAYTICEALKKKYRKEKVIDDITFKMFAFDDDITPVKYGSKTGLGGGTMSMSKLLKSIEKYSNDYLINIVVTDGYFDINETEVKNFIKNVNGIVVYVVNRDFPEMKKLADELNTKLFFIKAGADFKIDM